MNAVVATEQSVRSSRGIIRHQLGDWGVTEDLADSIELVASELLTNALRICADASRFIRWRLIADPDMITLAVYDPMPSRPEFLHGVSSLTELDDADGVEFGGWGLGICGALTETLTYVPAGPDMSYGKWITASFKAELKEASRA